MPWYHQKSWRLVLLWALSDANRRGPTRGVRNAMERHYISMIFSNNLSRSPIVQWLATLTRGPGFESWERLDSNANSRRAVHTRARARADRGFKSMPCQLCCRTTRCSTFEPSDTTSFVFGSWYDDLLVKDDPLNLHGYLLICRLGSSDGPSSSPRPFY